MVATTTRYIKIDGIWVSNLTQNRVNDNTLAIYAQYPAFRVRKRSQLVRLSGTDPY